MQLAAPILLPRATVPGPLLFATARTTAGPVLFTTARTVPGPYVTAVVVHDFPSLLR